METKQTVGSFDYVALELAKRDAEDRVRNINSRTEANALLTIAQREGDRILVKTVNDFIAKKWPTTKTDYALKLELDNKQILNMLQLWASNKDLQDLSLAASEGKITPEYRNTQYANYEKNMGWIEALDLLVTNSYKALTTETENLNKAIRELTTSYGNVNERLLTEMRDGKAWDRLRRELDNLTNMEALTRIQTELSACESDHLRMILTEAPSYLTSRGIDNPDKAIRSVLIQDIPQITTADATETNADIYHQAVRFNANWAKKKLQHLPATTLTTQKITTEANETFITPDKLSFK